MDYILGHSYTLPVSRKGNRLTVLLSPSSKVIVRIPDSLADYPFGNECSILYGPDKPGQWGIDKKAIFRQVYKDNTIYEFQTLPGDIKNIKVVGLYGFILSIPKINNGFNISEGRYRFLVQHHNSGVGIRLKCVGSVQGNAATVETEKVTNHQKLSEISSEIDNILSKRDYYNNLYDLLEMDTATMNTVVALIAEKWLLVSQNLTRKRSYIFDYKLIAECTTMLRMLAEMNPLSSFGLINKAKELLTFCRLGRAPFDISYIDRFNSAILAECLKKADFVIRHNSVVSIDCKATVLMQNGTYSFFPCNLENYDISYPFFSHLMVVGKDAINIFSHREDKLEISALKEEDEIIECVNVIIGRVKASPYSKKPKRIDYRAGDEFLCRITDIVFPDNNQSPYVIAESIDKKYNTISGEISLNDFYYFKDANIHKALKTGDIIKVTLTGEEEDFEQHLSVIGCFSKFIASGLSTGTVVRASLYHKSKNHNSWITRDGYTIYTKADSRLSLNTIADLSIINIAPNGYISGAIVNTNLIHAQFDPYKPLRMQLQSFVEQCRKEAIHADEIEVDADLILPEIIMTCTKLVFMQESLRYRFEIFVILSFLAAMSSHKILSEFAAYKLRYISNLIRFTQNRTDLMKSIAPGENIRNIPSVAGDCAIERLLRAYGHPEKMEGFTMPDSADKKDLIKDIQSLITAYNLSKDIMNRSILDSFRKRILTLLSLSDNSVNEVAYSDENDKDFVGYESSTLEFKTSIVFEAGKTESADFQKQARVILKTIFSFMNTVGGVLYIGVNDIGYVSGIESDMKYLNLTSIDSYCRYILDQLSYIAGRDIITSHVNADPDLDGRVVKITVTPSSKLLEFEGKYYKRVGPESRIMSENSILIELDRRGQ